MREPSTPVRALALIASLLCARTASAYGVSISEYLYAQSSGPVFSKTQTFNGPNTGTASQVDHAETIPFSSFGGVDLVGDVGAHAAFGTLGARASGQVDAIAFASNVTLSLDMKAIVQDTFTYTNPNVAPGAAVGVHGTLYLQGTLVSSHSNVYSACSPQPCSDYTEGSGQAWLNIYGSGIPPPPYLGRFYAYTAHGGSQYSGNTLIDDPAPASVTYSLVLIAGQPTPISLTLEVFGSASADSFDSAGSETGMGKFGIDFQHTLTWGGIDSITDASGNPITGGTLTSESGFDYMQPVPEPASGWLALSGSLVLGAVARRRTAKPMESTDEVHAPRLAASNLLS